MGKPSVYHKVAQSTLAQHQLAKCGERVDLEEEVLEELFKFTRQVIYGDMKSGTMAESRAAKWKAMKKKTFLRLPPDADSLYQHCLRANYLSYLARHPTLRTHPSPIGHGWELIDGRCRPVRHTRPALPIHLPAPMPSGESDEMESDDEEESDSHALGKMTECSSESDSDYSEAECFNMD